MYYDLQNKVLPGQGELLCGNYRIGIYYYRKEDSICIRCISHTWDFQIFNDFIKFCGCRIYSKAMGTDIRYAVNEGVNIAYRMYGEGEKVIIVIAGWVSNIDEYHLIPGLSEWIAELMKRGRVILFDKRGVGLSDRVVEKDLPGLGERMDDLRAIMDKEKIRKAVLYGFSEGGPMGLYFAAAFPERVEKLILYASFACWVKKPGYPEGISYQVHEKSIEMIRNNWGGPLGIEKMAPSLAGDELLRNGYASYLRKSASPGAAARLYQMNLTIDVRDILEEINVPVLVIHRENDQLIPWQMGEYIARHIKKARWELLTGDVHWPWLGNSREVMKIVDDFLDRSAAVHENGTRIGTIMRTRFYEKNQALLFGNFLSGAGLNGNIIFLSDREMQILFKSPDVAIHHINQYLDKELSCDLAAIIHTGVCHEIDGTLRGAALDLSASILDSLEEKGIFLTDSTIHLLSDRLHEYAACTGFRDQQTGVIVQLFRYQSRRIILNETIKQILGEGKIGIEDIRKLYEIRKYLDHDFLANPSLEKLCKQFGINTFKLKYGFKKLFDVSVKRYVKSLRLNYAYHLVKESDFPIEDIALRIGYSHTSTFTSIFGEAFGHSPKSLRKSIDPA
jgi:pimeloyl-ACP methyl ester carboxylesterase/AraC-like DNA-binding protein